MQTNKLLLLLLLLEPFSYGLHLGTQSGGGPHNLYVDRKDSEASFIS